MSRTDEHGRPLIRQEAADWFVANRAGLSAAQRDSFTAWLQVSPLHVEEYLGLAAIAHRLRRACAASARSVDIELAPARAPAETLRQPLWPRMIASLRAIPAQRWQTAAVAMAAFGFVSVGLLLLWNFRLVAPVSVPAATTALHFETGHGEQQTRRLADDSVVHLNTDSAVTVTYSKTQRLVILTAGEAAFEVAHESGRAFHVLAGPAEVVDLGTKFDVRLAGDSALVTVAEGRVAVGPSKPGGPGAGSQGVPRFVQVGADQQLRVTEGEWPAAPTAVDAQRTTAWLHRQIMFEREPLERVASEFNRYSPKPIEITTPALRSLEISGVFTTDDTRGFIAFLRSLDGVHVEVTPTRILVSQN